MWWWIWYPIPFPSATSWVPMSWSEDAHLRPRSFTGNTSVINYPIAVRPRYPSCATALHYWPLSLRWTLQGFLISWPWVGSLCGNQEKNNSELFLINLDTQRWVHSCIVIVKIGIGTGMRSSYWQKSVNWMTQFPNWCLSFHTERCFHDQSFHSSLFLAPVVNPSLALCFVKWAIKEACKISSPALKWQVNMLVFLFLDFA